MREVPLNRNGLVDNEIGFILRAKEKKDKTAKGESWLAILWRKIRKGY